MTHEVPACDFCYVYDCPLTMVVHSDILDCCKPVLSGDTVVMSSNIYITKFGFPFYTVFLVFYKVLLS